MAVTVIQCITKGVILLHHVSRRSLPESTRESLQEALAEADTAASPAAAAAVEAKVKSKALRALEGQLWRPLQVIMQSVALELHGESLQLKTTSHSVGLPLGWMSQTLQIVSPRKAWPLVSTLIALGYGGAGCHVFAAATLRADAS